MNTSINIILNKQQLQHTITRLAHQLLEDETDLNNVIFIGLQPRGIYISDKIIEHIRTLVQNSGAHSSTVKYGKLDITFYRDDFKTEFHHANKTDIPFSIEGKKVILIDDVLYTGRTIRAALDALLDFGRPTEVKLCVLVNRRFNRQLPIQPDYTGIAIDSIVSQKVKVMTDREEVIVY